MFDEVAYVVRQILPTRQLRSVHENWNDENLPFQGSGDFLADVVTLTRVLALFQEPQPTGSYDRQEHVALGQRQFQFLVKTLTGKQIVDVHEQGTDAKRGHERSVNARGSVARIFASIVDEDLARHAPCPANQAHNSRTQHSTEVSYLKPLPQPRLLQHFVRRVPRLDLAVHNHIFASGWAPPNIVIAFAMAAKFALGLDEVLAQLGREVGHQVRLGLAMRPSCSAMMWTGISA